MSDEEDEEHSSSPSMPAATIMSAMDSPNEEEAPPEPLTVVEDVPSSRVRLGDVGPIFVRLPNFLSIEPKPFDERTYEVEMDDDEVLDEEGRTRMKLKIENTVRWRNVRNEETGEVKKQSNAKIVKWSDGTQSLYLGSEIFEIQDQKTMPNVHLYTRQGTSLTAQAVFHRKFTFRPHSTDTLTHRKMTVNMADKSLRTQKVKMVTDVGMNPEKDRAEKVRREEEKLRAVVRRQAAQRRQRDRTREMGLTSGFIEGYDSDEGDSVGAIKRSYSAHGGSGGTAAMLPTYYSDESEEDERSRKQLRDVKVIDSDDDDEPAADGTPSSSRRETQKAKPKRRIIEDDDDDED